MKSAKIIYLIGILSFGIICGVGHLSFELLTPKDPGTINLLDNIPVIFPDKVTTLTIVTFGVSVMMGLLLITYGSLNLMFFRNAKTIPPHNIIYFNLIVCCIALPISLKYFFIVPTTLICISIICYTTTLILKRKL